MYKDNYCPADLQVKYSFNGQSNSLISRCEQENEKYAGGQARQTIIMNVLDVDVPSID